MAKFVSRFAVVPVDAGLVEQAAFIRTLGGVVCGDDVPVVDLRDRKRPGEGAADACATGACRYRQVVDPACP